MPFASRRFTARSVSFTRISIFAELWLVSTNEYKYSILMLLSSISCTTSASALGRSATSTPISSVIPTVKPSPLRTSYAFSLSRAINRTMPKSLVSAMERVTKSIPSFPSAWVSLYNLPNRCIGRLSAVHNPKTRRICPAAFFGYMSLLRTVLPCS